MRPSSVDQSQFQVLGECYVQGLNDGEAILGNLPSHRRVIRYDENSDTWSDALVDDRTGDVLTLHPALRQMEEGWRIHNQGKLDGTQRYFNSNTGEISDLHPNLSVDALRKRGVELRSFDLI